MYPKGIESVEELIAHIEFPLHATNGQPQNDSVNASIDAYYESIFEHALLRYLRGVGHPEGAFSADCLPEGEMEAQRDNGLLRARLFLKFATGSDLPPCESWKIKVMRKARSSIYAVDAFLCSSSSTTRTIAKRP